MNGITLDLRDPHDLFPDPNNVIHTQMAAFIIGFWAYIAALLGSIIFVLLGLFSRIIYLIYKQYGEKNVFSDNEKSFVGDWEDFGPGLRNINNQ